MLEFGLNTPALPVHQVGLFGVHHRTPQERARVAVDWLAGRVDFKKTIGNAALIVRVAPRYVIAERRAELPAVDPLIKAWNDTPASERAVFIRALVHDNAGKTLDILEDFTAPVTNDHAPAVPATLGEAWKRLHNGHAEPALFTL